MKVTQSTIIFLMLIATSASGAELMLGQGQMAGRVTETCR